MGTGNGRAPARTVRSLTAAAQDLADGLQPLGVTLPVLALIGGGVAALTWSLDNTTYDTWGGVVVLLGLGLVSVPVLAAMRRHEDDPRIVRLLVVALGLKMVGALARLAVAFSVYDGVADASAYHDAGVRLGPLYRNLDLSLTAEVATGGVGTTFMKQVTGWLYAGIGPTKLGAFFVFSWFGFIGLYCFYRAFRLAVPGGDHWRYALLVFLLPSLLFWPSSLGKEAWMMTMLGIAALGAARLYARRPRGIVLLLGGVAGLAAVRPHIAALLMISVFAAYLLGRARVDGATVTGPVAKLVGVLLLGGILVFAVGAAEQFFGVDEFNADSVNEVLDDTRAQTAQGGSQFGSEQRTNMNPSQFPTAVVNVLFRPFPWEASNPQAILAALEGTALLLLVAVSWRRVLGALRHALRHPYVLACCVYSVVFIYGFSSFANFGILTRQRVQLFPFVLVLICVPAWTRDPEAGWRSLLTDDFETGPSPTPATTT